MDIIEVLTREVEAYRKRTGSRPCRILLGREMAMKLAAEMVRRSENMGVDLPKFGDRTADERFLDGGSCFFKSIPVIAEIPDDDVLVIAE